MKGDANDRIERELRTVKTLVWVACIIGATATDTGWARTALLWVCIAGWAGSFIRK